MTPLRAAVRGAAVTLEQAGVPSAEHDARALAVHVLGAARPSDLLLVEAFDDLQAQAYDELVARRAQRVPLQHLTGRVGFRYLELLVGPGVFVPRPETEAVVQWAVDAAAGRPGLLCVDLCAGSGTIAFALANELPGAVVHAVERDPGAFVWLERNAEARRKAGDRGVTLHLGGALDALPELDGQVDLLVSNPPYVATDEAHLPEPEVVEHDPHLALFAGEDGLAVVREVEQAARRLLRPGGLVVVEHSDRQGTTAPEVFSSDAWTEVADHRDWAGRDRFVTATRR